LTKVIDLGDQYLQGSFIKPGKELPSDRKIPTQLVLCDPSRDEDACGLLQLSVVVPPNILYSSYWYRSGTNQTMRDHLKEIANSSMKWIPNINTTVLDIGCNDGTLLSNYPTHFNKFGVDPSDVADQVSDDFNVIKDFFPSNKLNQLNVEFNIITSIAMFYDLSDPVGFVENIKTILHPEGIWVFEMSYMPTMLSKNSYDTICHEHLEYYSFGVISEILNRTQMKVVDYEFNEINGGSIRCYATHLENSKFDNSERKNKIEVLFQKEFDQKLDTVEPYVEFQERINSHKHELKDLLTQLKNSGSKIHIYGASTKGNTILQWCGIDSSLIECAAERNPEKYGAKTLGTNIPIVSESDSRAMNPDYYLVLPWHFKEEFIHREKEMLNQGVGMIFPLPEIEVIKKN